MNRTPDGEAPEPAVNTTSTDTSIVAPTTTDSGINNTTTDATDHGPTPEPFDPTAAAAAIIDEARSIQELLRTYEQNTRQLKEEVQEFILREVAEQSRHKSLSVTVAQDELRSLQNAAYIKFYHQYKGAERGDCAADAVVMPTARIADGSSGVFSSSSSAQVGWAAAARHHAWAPDSAVALSSYGDLREVLLGWRGRSAASDGQLRQLCSDLFSSPSSDGGGSDSGAEDDVGLCCFFSGQLYTPALPSAAAAADLRSLFWHRLPLEPSPAPQHHRAVDAAVSVYTAVAAGASAVPAAAALESHLRTCRASRDNNNADDESTAESKDTTAAAAAAAGPYDNTRPQILGDVHDSVVCVRPARLAATQPFRAVFIRGELLGVEHLGPQVDALRILCPGGGGGASSDTTTSDRARQRICRTFEGLFAAFCGDGGGGGDAPGPFARGAVITAAIAAEPLPPAASDGDASLVHSAGVVLHICTMGPSLPFRWHFTWPEICSMGQVRAGASASTATPPVFKVTRLAVSEVSPFDALSAVCFPVLNDQITAALSGGGQAPAAVAASDPPAASIPQHKDPAGRNNTLGGVVAVGSAAAAIAAMLLLMRR